MDENYKSYIAGLMDGDGSIFVDRQKSGHSLHVEFEQCSRSIEPHMLAFGMSNYEDTRSNKYNNETAVKYRICGKKTKQLLELMRDYSVIKKPQAQLGMDFIPYIQKLNLFDKKETLALIISSLNNNKKYEKDFSKMNDAYIAGLFDAEGSAISKTNSKWYIQIVQSGSKDILEYIQKQFGSGSITSEGRWRIYNIEHAYEFYKRIRPYTIIKSEDLDEMVTEFNKKIKNKYERELITNDITVPTLNDASSSETTNKKNTKKIIKQSGVVEEKNKKKETFMENGTEDDYNMGYLETILKINVFVRKNGTSYENLYVASCTCNDYSLAILNKILPDVEKGKKNIACKKDVQTMKEYIQKHSFLQNEDKKLTINYMAGLFDSSSVFRENNIKISLGNLELCDKLKNGLGYGHIIKANKLWQIQSQKDIKTFNETIRPFMKIHV